MKYTPQHIVNYFLTRAEREGRPLTPLKLIKLVYIAYGWVLALTGKRLFDEPIQAWQHGPVIPSVYHEFKHYGKRPIEDKATCFDLDTFDFTVPEIEASDKETKAILDKVWSAYKMFSGWSLRQKTHEPGTPWSQTYEEGVSDKEIPDTLIAPHFKKRIREILDAADRQATF
ncbi:Panacea domain-containing protein [Methylopila henanensis]|uniref:Panacea domain-containing protein n=1 Tax=Methylopila henanensis TaxID=873516 RepID=A0ABW4K5K9_9HYPH